MAFNYAMDMQIFGEILPLKKYNFKLVIINISGHEEINYKIKTYRLNKRLNNFHSSPSSTLSSPIYIFSSMLHMHNSIYSTDTSIIFASWIESFPASSATERWILAVPSRLSTRELTVSAVNTLLISELDSSRGGSNEIIEVSTLETFERFPRLADF